MKNSNFIYFSIFIEFIGRTFCHLIRTIHLVDINVKYFKNFITTYQITELYCTEKIILKTSNFNLV